jgi:hypothetical protein
MWPKQENSLNLHSRFLDNIGIGPFGDSILQPNPWATGLANTRILNMLEIPYFGRGNEVKNCIK